MTIAIAGNPNCGKTVIFNALTGSTQKVGNWSGVTVDRKQGCFTKNGQDYTVVDIPGVYALHTATEDASLDERIACEYLLSGNVDLIINVIDASNLERHLYLTAQLLEMNIPMIIALNMSDIAKRRGIHIDTEKLSQQLGCQVIPMVASRHKGIEQLQHAVTGIHDAPKAIQYPFGSSIQAAIDTLSQAVKTDNAEWLALRLLEGDCLAESLVDQSTYQLSQQLQSSISQEQGEPVDLLIADARYQWVDQLVQTCSEQRKTSKQTITELVDKVVLNRFLGVPIFLFVMYATFFFAINVGGAFQDFFDIGSTTIFIDGLSHVLNLAHSPTWLTAVLANGLGKGINTVITFTPVIGGMFLFLAILEDSGYMARAAFVVDRLMRAIGLPGKAFVPLIVGFGCNVPTVMATRTLGSKRDRILTVMMAPFMSCGARLAIFAVFVGAFFNHGGQNIIFLLYLIGIVVAILTGLLLRFTLLRGEAAPMPTELPTYHAPHPISVLRSTWHRLKMFLKKAGRFIIPICMLIGALNVVSIHGKLLHGEANQESLLSGAGKIITPAFEPMGIKKENWPATVGLFTGLLAKEVVVGTLNTLYSQVGHLHQTKDDFSFWDGLKTAADSVPNNLSQLPAALKNPILASAPLQTVNRGVYGVMSRYFDGAAGAFAYLLFILLYFPCVSTMAVMQREISKNWARFSMVWTTGVAYGVSVSFYQLATIRRHVLSSSLWVIGVVSVLALVIIFLRKKTAPTTPAISSGGLSHA
jgi:ferrous iron transport protein B